MSKRDLQLKRLKVFCGAAALTLFCVGTSSALEGRYAALIHQLLEKKSFTQFQTVLPTLENPIQISCLETSGSRFYIGVAQYMLIEAPLSRVEKVIEDMDQYVDLFPGLAHVQVLSRESVNKEQGIEEKWTTAWEQKVPVFFIPNIKYQMIYFFSPGNSEGKTYHYQLDQPGTIKESNGMIALEKVSDHETRYTEIDFFDAHWGILEKIAPKSIWKDSVDGIYLSDLATKLKSEKPELSSKQARQAGEKIMETIEKRLKKSPGELCSEQKTTNWAERYPQLPVSSQN